MWLFNASINKIDYCCIKNVYFSPPNTLSPLVYLKIRLNNCPFSFLSIRLKDSQGQNYSLPELCKNRIKLNTLGSQFFLVASV